MKEFLFWKKREGNFFKDSLEMFINVKSSSSSPFHAKVYELSVKK